MSEPLPLCVSGASGRAGSLVVELLRDFPEFRLSGALVAPEGKCCGHLCLSSAQNMGHEVRYSASPKQAIQGARGVIDFSTPQASLSVLREAASLGVPALVATTGHSDTERNEIKELATKIPILLAPNTSTAVFVMQEIALLAQKLCGADFDIEIFEMHHKRKKDAPSGTALSLAHTLAAAPGYRINSARVGATAERQADEIGVAALRGGDLPGEHTIFFLGEGERIEITQRARDRSVFARGALRLMGRLLSMPAGLYSVRDLYSGIP